ncbi:hypothetical protein MJ561_27055 [Klebsiella pneumoniae]|nr:hypothetical protein MJ561_27055 [Klebsiella pneumoniae]
MKAVPKAPSRPGTQLYEERWKAFLEEPLTPPPGIVTPVNIDRVAPVIKDKKKGGVILLKEPSSTQQAVSVRWAPPRLTAAVKPARIV